MRLERQSLYPVGLTAVLFIGLFSTRSYSFLLFHTITEFICIGVMWAIFILVWNTRRMIDNPAVLFLGIVFFFVGCVDIIHTLSYKGMGVFQEYGANLPTQLWIAGRYLQSLCLLTAPFLLDRPFRPLSAIALMAGVTALLIASVFGGVFPDCFIEDTGLTVFKKGSEYLISVMLMVAIVLFYRRRERFDTKILRLILLSIGASIVSGLFFTFYVSVYGISNFIGHYFKLLAMLFLYGAMVETAIKKPFSFLFREVKEREEALRASEERHRTLLQTAMDGFMLIDLQGHLREVNETYCRMSGYSNRELLTMDIFDLETGETRENTTARIRKILATGEDRFESLHRGKDGRIFNVEVSVQHRATDGGQFVAFVRDITERKQTEARLQQAQKLEAIGTLAGGIAHDFNNILYPLVGFAELLKEDLPADSPLQGHIDEIIRAALRSKELVKQILAFSRKGGQSARPVRLNPIIKEALNLLRASIPSSIDIKRDIDSHCGPVIADPTQVHQIVMNLVTNAYHAMEDTGGQIIVRLKEIETASEPEPDSSVLQVPEPGKYALLTVTDAGMGMEKDVLEKVFDPYFTTKGVGKGTGLGLSVVQGIVKTYKGDIRIVSVPEKGTEVFVYLPILAQPAEGDTIVDGEPIGNRNRPRGN